MSRQLPANDARQDVFDQAKQAVQPLKKTKQFWILTGLTLLMLTFSASAGTAQPVFNDLKVRLSWETPPSLTGASLRDGGRLFVNDRFLAIGVQFTPRLEELDDEHKQKAFRPDAVVFLDQVELAVSVLIPPEKEGDGALLKGRTAFPSVMIDGREHMAYMFVPPQLLDRYAPRQGDGKRIKALKLGDFIVEAVFSVGGRELGRVYANLGAKERRDAEAAARLFQAGGKVALVENGVWPKDCTPWQYYKFDRYDLTAPSPGRR